jgi:tetratricopeptide (TPR) repeat protein
MQNLELQLVASRVPFSVARGFLSEALTPVECEGIAIALRPIFHSDAPKNSSLSDRQTIDDQLRFYNKNRCLRDFPQVAWKLLEKYPDGVSLTIEGDFDEASQEFFRAITPFFPVTIQVTYNRQVIIPERDEAFIDEHKRITQKLINEADWRWLHQRISHYLNCGDSWVAMWLAEAVLSNHRSIPAYVGDVLGLAYGLQDRTAESEQLFKLWASDGGIEEARAKYSLAMLYARHHSWAFHNEDYAHQLLEEAWNLLLELDASQEHVSYEKVFNRNGIALIYYRRREFQKAAELLEQCIATLNQTQYHSGVHHTVLTNNLGRLYTAMGEAEKAEQALKAAVTIDPNFAEYQFDLASFYADANRLDEALETARKAERLSSSMPAIPALMGYIMNLQGDYSGAVYVYKRAWEIDPFQAPTALAIVHNLCELSEYQEASEWYQRLIKLNMTPGETEMSELLKLEIDSHLDDNFTPDVAKQRLEELAERFPKSETIRENLLQFA